MTDKDKKNIQMGGIPLETVALLRQMATRNERIMRACQKINDGIAELCGTLASAVPLYQGPDISQLTPRHKEILGMVAKDVPTVDIAKTLKLSARTVDSHKDTMRKRLGFATVAELDEFAKTQGGGGI